MTEYIVKETGYPGRLETEIVGELIRCKDCKHWDKALPDIGWCTNIRHDEAVWWSGDDFCSRAERKDGEAE